MEQDQATGVITLPQASVTDGVGAVASAGQFTVEDPSAGNTNQVCRSCSVCSSRD
jgi:hypothetical protein